MMSVKSKLIDIFNMAIIYGSDGAFLKMQQSSTHHQLNTRIEEIHRVIVSLHKATVISYFSVARAF